MGIRCKLCRQELRAETDVADCECGWQLDVNCASDHEGWCPRYGQENWLGAVEI